MEKQKPTSHKDMTTKNIHASSQDIVQRFARLFQLQIDPQTQPNEYNPAEGHMLFRHDGSPVAWVRSQVWRPTEQIIPQRSDIGRFHPDSRTVNKNFNPFETEMGMELEPTIFDDTTGTMVPASTREDLTQQLQERLRSLGAGTSPELFEGTWELNLGHGLEQQERQRIIAAGLSALVDTTEAQGAHVIPLSALPHETQESNVTDHPYIRRMALKVEGFDRARWFGVMSSQMHWEIDGDWDTAFEIINLFQQITPILFAASLAGNIAMDTTHPNPMEFHRNNDALQQMIQMTPKIAEVMDTNQWLSSRPWLRLFGSTSSGPLDEPLPNDTTSFFRSVEAKLRAGKIPTPAREPGPHKDFRPRFDLNTIEACFFDTFGGNINQLAAFQTLTGIIFAKLWMAVKKGEVNALRSRLPRLFGLHSANPFTHVSENTLRVAQGGTEARIVSADETLQPTTILFGELLAFTNEPTFDAFGNSVCNGLPDDVLTTIINASLIPSQETITDWCNGIPSTQFFYETGIGTLAHSIQARIAFLQSQGMSESEIIENVKQDVGESFHRHVKSFQTG